MIKRYVWLITLALACDPADTVPVQPVDPIEALSQAGAARTEQTRLAI
jgi:hypothetical protein